MHKVPSSIAVRAACMLVAGVLASCGLKGPLYLPEQASGIVTRPTQTPPEPANAPNSPQTIDSPASGATPAPEVTAPAVPGTTPDTSAPAEEETDTSKKEKGAAPSPR